MSFNHPRQLAFVGGAALLALLAAGCGSSTSSDATGEAPSTTPVPSRESLSVAVTSLGRVVVDSGGFTVYMLTADSSGRSTCSSVCLSSWPPVAGPSSGASSSPDITAKVGEAATTTGNTMLTVGGWPVYRYVQDTAPGDVTGEGITSFGGTWYAIGPNGQPVTGAPGSPSPSQTSSPSQSPSPSGSSSGYSY
jgi:predicted lipoprotein with Yx(FWY)xxD motif